MNPRLMLSLWRTRWGKAAGTTFKVPYVRGKINQWTHGLPHADAWSVPGVTAVALLLCLVLMGLMIGIGLSFNSQIVFSVFFVGVAVYVRRYAGTLITLVLVGMALIASTRYLYWRFDATLVQDFSLGFMFGFYLWVAECYLALLVCTGLIQSIWPLKRLPAVLPRGQDEWPTVDVFILCHDQPYAAIKASAMAAQGLDWPGKKIKTYLIEGGQSGDLQALATSIRAHHLPISEAPSSLAGWINLALPLTHGALIAVFESGQTPDKSFLQSTVGWFLRDQKLGMAQTPHHFLAPAPPRHALEIFRPPSFARSGAVLRRSAMVEVAAKDTALEPSHLAFKLQDAGYGCAYLGVADAEASGHENQEAQIFLVEHPFSGRTLRCKQWLADFQGVLQFYYPVPRLLFFTAPVVYLLGDVQIIHASPELLAAYALPHFVHAHIARTRTHGNNRFTLVADIKETVLAWYLLMPVTLSLLRTKLSQCLRRLFAERSDKSNQSDEILNAGATPLFAPWVSAPYVFVLSLNLAGFFSGMFHVLLSGSSQLGLTVIYLLWAAYNLMLLAAVCAVAEEARQVRKHTCLRRRMPAMIKLPSGRTLSCATENFPESGLKLTLPMPMPVALPAGSPVSISIFHGHRELVFPATVLVQRDLTLRAGIAEAAQHDYQTFAVAVLSRGPGWPKWLPDRGADRPFPKWVTDALVAVPIAVLDFATNISKHLRWARLDSWIQLWKKKT